HGELGQAGLVAPELELQTDAIIALTANTILGFYTYYDANSPCNSNFQPFGEVAIDFSRDYALAGSGNGGPADPADALVDAYNVRYLTGEMRASMRNTLVNYLSNMNWSWAQNGEDWRRWRIGRALYLILTSHEYMVQKYRAGGTTWHVIDATSSA